MDGMEALFKNRMWVLEELGEASGLWVSWDKSLAFPIGPVLSYDYLNRSNLQMDHSFRWASKFIIFLNLRPLISPLQFHR